VRLTPRGLAFYHLFQAWVTWFVSLGFARPYNCNP